MGLCFLAAVTPMWTEALSSTDIAHAALGPVIQAIFQLFAS